MLGQFPLASQSIRIVSLTLNESGSWTPEPWMVGLMATVRAAGPGASGPCLSHASARASGPGAGGLAEKRAVLTNVAHTVVMGLGGAPVTTGNNGNAGSAPTTFVGGAFNLSAGPGQPGSQATTGALAGGAGGTATGGDNNYTGGAGGDVGNNTLAAAGGGAIGWNGPGKKGGSVTNNSSVGTGAGLGAPGRNAGGSLPQNRYYPGGAGVINFAEARAFGAGARGIYLPLAPVELTRELGVGGAGTVHNGSNLGGSDAGPGGGGGATVGAAALTLLSGAGGDGWVVIDIEVPY